MLTVMINVLALSKKLFVSIPNVYITYIKLLVKQLGQRLEYICIHFQQKHLPMAKDGKGIKTFVVGCFNTIFFLNFRTDICNINEKIHT